MPTRDFVILYVNGQRHEIRGERAFKSLSDFLRYDLSLIGTKVVCAEGDCGSCSIMLGRSDGTQIKYETVCSCIQFLYQLDCTHILTIEGLKYDGALNPIQEAMVACQGTQCGFCTPGFVVSLCAMFDKRTTSPAPEEVQAACIGNLCRCTGYESIVRAGTSIDPSKVRSLRQLYPPEKFVAELRERSTDSVLVESSDRKLYKPTTVADAGGFRAANPGCTIVAGATDIGVQVNKNLRDPKLVLALSGLDDLRRVEQIDQTIVAGALASITQLETISRTALPEYAAMLKYFGSSPIRNAGTIGGNIANGSPIGDSMPALFVLNAEVELTGTNGVRRVNMNDFYKSYRTTVATPDELITRVFIPLPAPDEIFKLYKISRRKDLDISAFTAAIWMKRNGGEVISDVRIAFGGVGPVILRLKKTEEYLRGNALTAESVREAGRIARTEITPITDVRGSAEYRSQLGENILRKFYVELSEVGSNGNGNGTADAHR
ncbi:MAG: FAD binding domain-containing protein [Anaerolineae bacterium]|nr:FAD binding domain-containing protein [Phycisphaerae bacterium]